MDKTIGVLGGGQLGRMLQEAANRLNINLITLDVEESPSKQINAVSQHINGSFKDPNAIRQLAEQCDILTIEIEHVDTDILEDLSAGTQTREDWRLVRGPKVEIQPSWRTIRTIQDKYEQKEHLIKNAVATALSIPLEHNSLSDIEDAAEKLGYPLMLKSRTEAYDGRGNYPIKRASDAESALKALRDRPLYAEQWADFKLELAIMVVKTKNDATEQWQTATMAFPVVETVHEDSICKLVYAPARNVSASIQNEAQALARRAVAGFWGKGVFGVEMFLLEKGKLLINEIAPRPHNSGHYTIEACPLSQYDAHLCAILDLPIPEEGLNLISQNTNAIMLNILGGAQKDSHLRVRQAALSIPGRRIHVYGKGDARPGRKMGHITILGTTMDEAERRIKPLIELVDNLRSEREQPFPVLSQRILSFKTVQQSTMRSVDGADTPLVAVTMGSDSDLPVLVPGLRLLEDLGVSFTTRITSAHRTPDAMSQFAKAAGSHGIKVIIAAAGGAAHLPGMIAANTWLPVIGVPVKGSSLDGVDSLHSIVQMPKGCPVATVGINNSVNAAQLATRILAAADVNIRSRLETYLENQTKSVIDKAARLQTEGFEAYLLHM